MVVSVIVPFRNAESYVEDCVHALLAQECPSASVEIIMVENNSTDGSADIVRRYPQVRLLSEHKPGAYAARNLGITEAAGEVLAFTDSDCVPCVSWLEHMSVALSGPDVGIVLGRHRFASDSRALFVLADYEQAKATYVFCGGVKELYYGYTNNMAVKRELFDRLGLFREIARGADTIFVRRAVDEYGHSIACYCPEACVRHLEIDSEWDYYRKQLIYGGSNRNSAEVAAYRPLTNRERGEVFRQTAGRSGYSVPKAALLLCLLGLGAICYELGRRLTIRPRPFGNIPASGRG
jgi:glycosyltransferase involved in cell wall biosynthesis